MAGRESTAPAQQNADTSNTPLRLVFVGDVMLARNIGDIIATSGPEYPFEYVPNPPFLIWIIRSVARMQRSVSKLHPKPFVDLLMQVLIL